MVCLLSSKPLLYITVQNMQPISAVPVNNKKGAKNVNYASVTCGAKIRASNPEAQHPGFILTENKDQYMINPCKVKKWSVLWCVCVCVCLCMYVCSQEC